MIYTIVYQTSVEYDSDYRGGPFGAYKRNFRTKENAEKYIEKLNSEYGDSYSQYHVAFFENRQERDDYAWRCGVRK